VKRRAAKSVSLTHPRLLSACFAAVISIAAFVGCQQQMASQPSYRPLVRSRFFADGRASRPLVAGTIARDTLEIDPSLVSGRKSTVRRGSVLNAAGTPGAPPATSGVRPEDFVTEFPFKITADVLARGRDQYSVYCAICHDASGTGTGKIVQRGFTKPPSYLADNSRQLARSGFQLSLREVPVGYLFDVATNGYGAMADYSTQVAPRDRWAIAAYIRTLQLSQNIPLDELPLELRAEALKSLEATP
jgi:mono/diheme cytochrome c family protein